MKTKVPAIIRHTALPLLCACTAAASMLTACSILPDQTETLSSNAGNSSDPYSGAASSGGNSADTDPGSGTGSQSSGSDTEGSNDTSGLLDNIAEDESRYIELFAMDTVMTLTAYGPNSPAALKAAGDEIMRLDELFSISSETGDIYALNRDGSGALSDDSSYLLGRALDISAGTDGIFDVTIEPVMEAWGFTDENYRVPSDSELADLLSRVDYTTVDFDGSYASLPEDVRIDLGGIAKGYASSRVMDIFSENGVSSGIISLGGNVHALGVKPDGSLWRVGIQDPWDLNELIAIIEIEDKAVITSGAYQRYFEEDGVTYHHIIDPRNGYPANNGLVSVTIVCDDGTLADALSTSLYILGPEASLNYWARHKDEFEAILVTDDGDIYITNGLQDCFTLKSARNVQIVM